MYNVTELKMINGYQCIWSEQSICTWPVFEPLKQWVASVLLNVKCRLPVVIIIIMIIIIIKVKSGVVNDLLPMD